MEQWVGCDVREADSHAWPHYLFMCRLIKMSLRPEERVWCVCYRSRAGGKPANEKRAVVGSFTATKHF